MTFSSPLSSPPFKCFGMAENTFHDYKIMIEIKIIFGSVCIGVGYINTKIFEKLTLHDIF